MMKKLMTASMIAAMGLIAGGCVMASGPISAGITLDQRGAVAGVDNSVRPTRTGTAMAKGILIFSSGDASIKAAMENGNIKKVHHVDSEQMNILGVYAEHTTIVYGE